MVKWFYLLPRFIFFPRKFAFNANITEKFLVFYAIHNIGLFRRKYCESLVKETFWKGKFQMDFVPIFWLLLDFTDAGLAFFNPQFPGFHKNIKNTFLTLDAWTSLNLLASLRQLTSASLSTESLLSASPSSPLSSSFLLRLLPLPGKLKPVDYWSDKPFYNRDGCGAILDTLSGKKCRGVI